MPSHSILRGPAETADLDRLSHGPAFRQIEGAPTKSFKASGIAALVVILALLAAGVFLR